MKAIRFCGRSLSVIRGFPTAAKLETGYQLDRVQHGLEPTDWKPMPSVGPGVREIRIMHEGQYRVIYVTKYADAICVLHAFQKKTQKTKKHDIETARLALRQLRNEA